MPSGPNRKPTEIRRAEGNRGRRPIPNTVRLPARAIAPDYLTDSQKELWRQIEKSAPAGVYTAADVPALERMVMAWDLYRRCQAEFATNLYAVGSMGQLTPAPAIRIMAIAAVDMHKAGGELGLSPVARTRITQPENVDDDPFALLLEGMSAAPPEPRRRKMKVIE